MRIILIVILYLSTCSVAFSATEQAGFLFLENPRQLYQNAGFELSVDNTQIQLPKFRKLKAVLLAIFLGHFGVHRIYLGTSPNVPIVYSLTLGGGFGLLPLLDIVAILTAKDLDRYANNKQVFMWSKSKR